MIDNRCLGNDVDPANISPDATVTGSSYITGARTKIAAGAVVRDSRLHDADIAAGAVVQDSILITEGHGGHSHKCDAAGRIVVRAADQPAVGEGSKVSGCTLINTSVGSRSSIVDTWTCDCRIGDDCNVRDAKIIITNTSHHVTVTGPTEISEAYLGHHATIDRRGYFEGVFSNNFYQLRCDEAGRLKIAATVDLPHVSMYGFNSINSTNSGKLLPQNGQPLKSFGDAAGLWRDRLLNHEQIELAPCCLVTPWTKVIGQSPAAHHSEEELVNDELTTYMMSFAIAGYQGDLTRGLVMPGELSVGLGTKQRVGGWLFTYSPDAIFTTVARLHDALEAGRKHLADTIVVESLKNAIEVCKAMAAKAHVDLSIPHDKQRMGNPKWIGHAHDLLRAHLQSGIWQFKEGRPVGWSMQDGKWTHPGFSAVLAIAPDAIDKQKSLAELYDLADPVPAASVAVPTGAVKGTGGDSQIHPKAKIAKDAIIRPGCRIGAGVTVASGACVWNSVLENCTIAAGARVARSVVLGGSVGANSIVRSSRLTRSALGADSTCQCASILDSELADNTTVSAFADVSATRCKFGTILGGRFENTDIDVYLMSMHMAGGCSHMRAMPIDVMLDGRKVSVPAIPMLGGGSLIRGTAQKPVEMQCMFLGSNAIIDAGTYLGFGCFVLGQLGPDAGLLPFTTTFENDPRRHQIGSAMTSMASTVITHFVAWTYNACGGQGITGGGRLADAVAQMCRAAITEGIEAIEFEQARRAGTTDPSAAARFAKYRSLPCYSDEQLAGGLTTYRRSLDSGAWDMACVDNELRFTSTKGSWQERSGSALWKPE